MSTLSNSKIAILWIGLAACSTGCCSLGIPSLRYDDSNGWNEMGGSSSTEGMEYPAEDQCGTLDGCDEELIVTHGPAFAGHFGLKDKIKNHIEKARQAKHAPPWPRFHPLPSRPPFAPQTGLEGTESTITYGRFGKAEATPASHSVNEAPL